MNDYILPLGLIILAILLIDELVRFKVIPQFNLINLVYHAIAASSLILGIDVTAAPDIVRVILILLGLAGMGVGFRTEKRPKKPSKPEVES